MNEIHWETAKNGSKIARDRSYKDEIVAVIQPENGSLIQVVRIASPTWIESRFNGPFCDEDEDAIQRHVEDLVSIRDYLTPPAIALQESQWKLVFNSAYGEPGYVRQYRECAAYVARACWLEKPWYFFDGRLVGGFYSTADQAMRACDSQQASRDKT